MLDYRFFNTRILQFNKDFPSVSEGEVWIKDGLITYVGPAKKNCRESFKSEKDCHGNLLIPGFKNAHAHTGMTFLRSHADDLPLQTWLTKQVFPYENLLTPEDSRTLLQLGLLEYVCSGITSAFDMYFHRDVLAQTCIEAGFRFVMIAGFSAKDLEHDYPLFSNMHPLISCLPGAHAQYTTSNQELSDLAALVQQYKQPFCIHLHETAREVRDCKKEQGMSPLALLEKLGVFKYGGTGFHLVHLDNEDYEILKRNKIYAVSCPASNLKLSSGIAPVCRMLKEGIPVALGTDGAASNNGLDMFREMYLASVLQKYKIGPAALDAGTVLRMACVNGAHAMHLKDCDDILEGKKADLVLLDMHQPNMQPENNIPKNIVYAGNRKNVILTMINGKIVYESDKYYMGFDPEEIYYKANQIIQRMDREIG